MTVGVHSVFLVAILVPATTERLLSNPVGEFAGCRLSSAESVVAEAPGTSESLSRVNFFGDLAYNLPLLKIVAEIGHATGGTVETYNSFSGGRADQSYTYGSLGIRLSW